MRTRARDTISVMIGSASRVARREGWPLLTSGRLFSPLLALSLLLFAGCVSGGAGVAVSESSPDAKKLALAGGDEDEVWGFLPKPKRSPVRREKTSPEPRRKPAKESGERGWKRPRKEPWSRPRTGPHRTRGPGQRFLLHAGILVTDSEKEGEWKPAGVIDASYRLALVRSPSVVYDLGLGFASVERDDGLVTSKLVFLRGEALFGRWRAWKSRPVVYVLGGVHMIFGESQWRGAGTDSTYAGGVEVGVGIGPARGRWDLRAVYSLLAGSGNVRGNLLIAAGLSL